jgi:micrococcal nuclease
MIFRLIFFLLRVIRRILAYRNVQPESRPYKIKAQSEFIVKDQIESFPTAEVKWVCDGDTVIVTRNGNETTVRLDSIDCPEEGQEWGDTAKYGLIKLIGQCNIKLEEHGIDSHGRLLATLYVWDQEKDIWQNVNERMVVIGHAWVMRGFYDHLPQDRKNKYNRLEFWAKSKKVGLWRTSDPIPPWEWRKM